MRRTFHEKALAISGEIADKGKTLLELVAILALTRAAASVTHNTYLIILNALAILVTVSTVMHWLYRDWTPFHSRFSLLTLFGFLIGIAFTFLIMFFADKAGNALIAAGIVN